MLFVCAREDLVLLFFLFFLQMVIWQNRSERSAVSDMQQQYCIVRDYCCKSVILSLWIRDPVVIVGKKCQCQVGFGLGAVSK